MGDRHAFYNSAMAQFAKILVLLGGILILAGGVVYLFSRLNIPLGHLPGDFHFGGENVNIYLPCATSIILSIILTILLNVILRMFKK
jgi:hypothetical protein